MDKKTQVIEHRIFFNEPFIVYLPRQDGDFPYLNVYQRVSPSADFPIPCRVETSPEDPGSMHLWREALELRSGGHEAMENPQVLIGKYEVNQLYL